MTTLTISRALTARVAQRIIRLTTIIAFFILAAAFALCGLLAYVFSGWWWLLLVPFLLLFSVFLVVRLIVLLIVRRIHAERMSKVQRDGLDHFIDTIQSLLEARATPPPLFIAITLKDLVVHRDITTVKKLIRDTAGLRQDYARLETLF